MALDIHPRATGIVPIAIQSNAAFYRCVKELVYPIFLLWGFEIKNFKEFHALFAQKPLCVHFNKPHNLSHMQMSFIRKSMRVVAKEENLCNNPYTFP